MGIWPYALSMRTRSISFVVSTVVVAAVACGSRTSLESYGPIAAPNPCGNGIVETAEQCDDGNIDSSDSCIATCVKAVCGDGFVHIGVELCDNGWLLRNDGGDTHDGDIDAETNMVDGGTCTSHCGPPTCGDGVVQPPEVCDDKNFDDTDACLSSCLPARCGDGFVRAGVETCDDGDTLDTNDCTTSCLPARCGDGFTWKGHEECDDGNVNDLDGCDNNCKLPVCGDGKVASTEACDLGANNGDRPAFLISQPSGTRIGTNPIIRKKTSSSFYNYYSASSHTGLEQVGESRIYLYVDSATGRLSLVLTHGIDDDTGQAQPTSVVEMDIAGLPSGFQIDLADDEESEFFKSSSTTASGRWNFTRNSDGGVLGGLPFPGAWKVTVTPKFTQGITTWGWVKDTLVRIPLIMTETITIEAFAAATACRTNCTVPRCGDGVLDGGEVCDDGNTKSGDGCNATCTSLN